MNAAIIAAGGLGERAGLSSGKQLALVAGRPVLSHTLAAFIECDAVDEIVVVATPDRIEQYLDMLPELDSEKVRAVVAGGQTRQASVAAGLAEVPALAEIIAVHDGARPLIAPSLIAAVIDALRGDPELAGLVVGHPSYDTLKQVNQHRLIVETPDRTALWAAQTPQVFRAAELREAYEVADSEGYVGTDDASLVERLGGRVAMFPGPRDNLKITVPEDLLMVERLLELRSKEDVDG